jgi:dTDP-4-amino-4,6-dideoxygalactose transaminase
MSKEVIKIPLVNLVKQYHSIKKEIDEIISGVLNSGSFVLGTNVKEFEQDFASYIGVKYGIGVGSGTDALRLALEALEVRAGDEVITVSFTFTSSVDCIVHNGAVPVFADINPSTYTMDIDSVKSLITKKTKAIIAVHLYGNPVDLEPLLEISEKYDLHVIEDAAQAHGAKYNNKTIGSFGYISCFSFYPSKNLGAYGDAGLVATNDDELAQRIRMLREYGQRQKYFYESVGYNSRLDEIQAAILRVKLKYLDKWNAARRRNAKVYSEYLNEISDSGKIILPTETNEAYHVYHVYGIRAKNRDELKLHLLKNGIQAGIHYPIPVHLQQSYRHVPFRNGKLLNTELMAKEELSLPMFPELTESEIGLISQKIIEFMK